MIRNRSPGRVNRSFSGWLSGPSHYRSAALLRFRDLLGDGDLHRRISRLTFPNVELLRGQLPHHFLAGLAPLFGGVVTVQTTAIRAERHVNLPSFSTVACSCPRRSRPLPGLPPGPPT